MRNPEHDALDEHLLTARARPDGTLHFGVGTILSAPAQASLDRLIHRGLLQLIDLIPDSSAPGRLVRVFQITKHGDIWLHRLKPPEKGKA